MTLHPPFFIGSTLSPALRIGEATLHLMSVKFEPASGRNVCHFFLEGPTIRYNDHEMRTGVGSRWGTVELFETFVGFMSAAAEADGNSGSDNLDLFPPHVMAWCADNRGEIESASCYLLDENGNVNHQLIEDDHATVRH